MGRSSPTRLRLTALTALLALSARADAPPPLATLPVPVQVAPASAAAHTLSPATSAKLAAGLPKFLTRPAASPAGPVAAAPVDLREIDRPRNTIVRLPNFQEEQAALRASSTASADSDPPRDGVIRLPNYEVRDRKLPAFKAREMLTPEGKIALEFKRHPGLRIGNLFGLNRGIAAAMAGEEDAYQRRLEMADLVGFQQFVATLPPPQSDDALAPAATTPAPAPGGK